MRAQPPASHWIAGAPFDDAAGRPLAVRYPATGEDDRPPPRSPPPPSSTARSTPPRDGFAAWSATPAGRSAPASCAAPPT